MEIKGKTEPIKSTITSNEKLFIVTREIYFYAMHNLAGRDIHIHRFCVTINFSGTKKCFSDRFNSSLLINYLDIDKIWKNYILPELVDSEKKITIKNSSCEILAEWIFDKIFEHEELFKNCFLHSVKVNDGDITVEILQRGSL